MNVTPQTELIPELADLRRQFESVNSDARAILADLTDAEVSWRAEPGRWSIGQCFGHLIVAARADLPHIEHAIDDGWARGLLGTGPFRYNPLERILTRSMDESSKIKVRNPRVYAPAPTYSASEITTSFFHVQDELLRLVNKANGLHLRRVRVTLAMTKLFTLSLGQEFAIVVAHERRHLAQARRVRALSGTALRGGVA